MRYSIVNGVLKMARALTGQKSLFRVKVRAPVSITLTRGHHAKIRRAMKRLGLTRADTIALLIERYGDKVTLPRGKKR